MSNQNHLRLPMLSVFLLQFLLSLPTSSFSLSPPRRFLTPLQAAGNSYEDGADPDGRNEKDGNPFEQFVRSVTRNENYAFGDITRTVVNTTTTGVEDVVRAVTHDEDYRFGDLTKKVVGSTTGFATGGVEGMVKSVTGNENYRFGDLTRGTVKAAGSVMTYSEKTLGLMRDHNVHELVELMNFYWFRTMNEDERAEAFAVFVYFGAILVLAHNFVANLMSGMVFAVAWTKVSSATGISPLAPGMWSKFLETKSTLDVFFGGPCVPVRAILTIPWFFKFRRITVGLAHNSPLREKFPTINRCISVLLTYAVANLGFVGGVTYLMMKMLSLRSGVPIFPVA